MCFAKTYLLSHRVLPLRWVSFLTIDFRHIWINSCLSSFTKRGSQGWFRRWSCWWYQDRTSTSLGIIALFILVSSKRHNQVVVVLSHQQDSRPPLAKVQVLPPSSRQESDWSVRMVWLLGTLLRSWQAQLTRMLLFPSRALSRWFLHHKSLFSLMEHPLRWWHRKSQF